MIAAAGGSQQWQRVGSPPLPNKVDVKSSSTLRTDAYGITSLPGQSDPGQSDPGPSLPGQSDPGPSLPGQSDPGPSLPGQVFNYFLRSRAP